MSRRPRGRPLTTLLPYRTDSGPVLLGARGVDAETYELAWARPTGTWHGFGVLRLSSPSGEDADVTFDPVQRQISGLRQYAAVVRLREPAYRSARRSRDQDPVARRALSGPIGWLGDTDRGYGVGMTTPDESQTKPTPGSGSGATGQVSEVANLAHAGEPISPEDSVAGAPTGESGHVDEGPTGPDAVTNSSRQDRHPDKSDVETTG